MDIEVREYLKECTKLLLAPTVVVSTEGRTLDKIVQ